MLFKINVFYKTKLFFLIILASVVFVIYGQSINYKLTNIDDDYLVNQNITYISNFKNIPKFFTESCYYSKEFPYYRPILSLSFATEAIFFGYNLKITHIANIIYFILSIFCIFLLVSKLKFNISVIKFICLLVAVHPILMSCPVWIPARNDTLLVIFFTLTLTTFIKFIETNNIKNLVWFIFLFTLSIFTKETALIFLPIFPLTLYCFDYKISKQQLLKIFALFLPILAIYFTLRHISITTPALVSYFANYKESVSIIVTGLLTYVDKFVIPDYLPIMLNNIDIIPKLLIVNIVVLSLIILLCFTKFINKKIILFTVIWFVLSLLPTFFISNYALLFHRFMFPSVSMVIILSELISKTITKYPVTKKYLVILFFILFTIFALNSHVYSSRFQNAELFWTNAYIDSPNYTETLHGFTRVLITKGNYQQARKLLNESAMKFKYYNYISNLGCILLLERKYDEAEKIFLEALKNNNEKYITHQYYLNLSTIYLHKMDFKKSIEFAEKSLHLSPHNTDSIKILAQIYAVMGEYQKAIDILLNLLKSDKNNMEYIKNLALLYQDLNDSDNAIKYARKILKIEPAHKIALDVLKQLKS
jgi:hypothetical protein